MNSIYIHSQTALPKEYSNLLKEGSSVLVRILKDTGNGKYTASFAGGRYTISSKEKLEPGATFMAKVSLTDGKLNLLKIQNTVQNQAFDKTVVHSSNSLSPQVAELLMSLGLPADSVSKMLLQTLVSSGVKINLEKLNRARNAAMNFPGQEDEAAEAALILLDKGIAPTIENIRDVMTGFGFSSEVKKNPFKINDSEKSESEVEQIAEEIREYFKSLFGKQSSDDGEDFQKQKFLFKEMPQGFLTVFNHMAANCSSDSNREISSDEKLHWIVVPFEFGFEKGSRSVNGYGVFRVFLDLREKNVRKSVINFIIDGEMWSFVVSFKGESLSNIKFSHSPQFDEQKNTLLKTGLSGYFDNVSVEHVSTEDLAGFGSGDMMLSLVKGYA